MNTNVYTFSQYPRCASISGRTGWQCVNSPQACGRIPNKWMGYMVRTSSAKYVEWRPFNDVFVGCRKPSWNGLPEKLQRQFLSVNQIDPTRTGASWNQIPVQRELFTDYSINPTFTWGEWEKSNTLVDNNGDQSTIADALEFGAAIRWRFDPTFAPGSAVQPCSGNGVVKLKNRTAWTDLSRDPSFDDVFCDCVAPWSGPLCNQMPG